MVLAVAAVLTALATAAEGDVSKEAAVVFPEVPNRHTVSGFGAEWDPQFWRSFNVRRGCDEAAWATVLDRIRDMGIARVRTAILPDWYEPENDNPDPAVTDWDAFTWDTEPMRSLYRHLDFCQEAGIKVTLTWWCAPVKRQSDGKPYWLASAGAKAWCSAPNDIEECAENVVAGLVHLIDGRGYTCIDTFTFYNEPDWAYYNDDDQVDFDHYAAVCRAIHRRLTQAGLRQRLILDMADASAHGDWLAKSAEHLGEAADRFNVHSYVFSCEDPGYPEAIREWVRRWVGQCGDKPLATNELGTRHYTGAYGVTDLETFERAFLTAQYAILSLCEGATGALFWGIYDQYYYDGHPDDGSNGGLMKTNLMGYITEGWKVRPTGEAWTLICHGAPMGARVYPGRSDDPDVDGVACLTEAGEVHVLLANRAGEPRALRLDRLPGAADGAAEIRTFTRSGLSAVTSVDGSGSVEVPAESIAWLRMSKP